MSLSVYLPVNDSFWRPVYIGLVGENSSLVKYPKHTWKALCYEYCQHKAAYQYLKETGQPHSIPDMHAILDKEHIKQYADEFLTELFQKTISIGLNEKEMMTFLGINPETIRQH